MVCAGQGEGVGGGATNSRDPKGKLANNTVNNSPEAVRRAQEMRSAMSVSEKRLWELLRGARTGFKFRRQRPVLDYFLDFYCTEAKLGVEIDGPHHADQRARDATRDRRLAEIGILTVRIPAADLFEPMNMAISHWRAEISRLCEARSGRLAWMRDHRIKRD